MCNSLPLSKVFAILLLMSIGCQLLHAQGLPYETVTVDGQSYYKYKVQPGEGLYAISRTFSVSVAEILRHNPGASNGLQSGQELLIPTATPQAPQATASSNPADQNISF